MKRNRDWTQSKSSEASKNKSTNQSRRKTEESLIPHDQEDEEEPNNESKQNTSTTALPLASSGLPRNVGAAPGPSLLRRPSGTDFMGRSSAGTQRGSLLRSSTGSAATATNRSSAGGVRPGVGGSGDADLFGRGSNSSTFGGSTEVGLSEEQQQYIAAAKWCTPLASGILNKVDLGSMRTAEIICLLQAINKVLPFWKGNTDQQLVVVNILEGMPWQRYLSDDEIEKLCATFLETCKILATLKATYVNSIMNCVLRPFTSIDTEVSILERQQTLALFVVKEIVLLYPTRRDVLVDTLAKQALTACFPLRRWPHPEFHRQYINLICSLMLDDDLAAKMEELSAVKQSTTATGASGNNHQGSSAKTLAAGGGNALMLGRHMAGIGGSGAGIAQFGARNAPVQSQSPTVVWQQFREALLNLVISRLSEMEVTIKGGEDRLGCANLLEGAYVFAGCFIYVADQHRKASEAAAEGITEDSPPPPLWWPSLLAQTYRERLIKMGGVTVVMHLMVPSILSFVSSQCVLDLLHSTTSLVLKESQAMSYRSREVIASHLYSLHYLLRFVPDIHPDMGLIRRTGKWIESAFKADEARRSELSSVVTIPVHASLKSTDASVAGEANSIKEGKGGGPISGKQDKKKLSAMLGEGHKGGNKKASELELENIPTTLLDMVFQQHVAICELNGMPEEDILKDISTEHFEVLKKRTDASGLVPTPYDSTGNFPVFGALDGQLGAGNGGDGESVVGDGDDSTVREGSQTSTTMASTMGGPSIPPQTPLFYPNRDLGTPAFARHGAPGSTTTLLAIGGTTIKKSAHKQHATAVAQAGNTQSSSNNQSPLMQGDSIEKFGSGSQKGGLGGSPLQQQTSSTSLIGGSQTVQKSHHKGDPLLQQSSKKSTSLLPAISPISGPLPPAFAVLKKVQQPSEAAATTKVESAVPSQRASPMLNPLQQNPPPGLQNLGPSLATPTAAPGPSTPVPQPGDERAIVYLSRQKSAKLSKHDTAFVQDTPGEDNGEETDGESTIESSSASSRSERGSKEEQDTASVSTASSSVSSAIEDQDDANTDDILTGDRSSTDEDGQPQPHHREGAFAEQNVEEDAVPLKDQSSLAAEVHDDGAESDASSSFPTDASVRSGSLAGSASIDDEASSSSFVSDDDD